mmetsp:Transcript_3192/g.4950  ORF Transcript_3192/g.4950 Transcript_3192/m.4950 type:complete len:155 (-) Transcript_3192:90-554(-)
MCRVETRNSRTIHVHPIGPASSDKTHLDSPPTCPMKAMNKIPIHKSTENFGMRVAKKCVRFVSNVEVYLIPTIKELRKEALWWSKSELKRFQEALISALPNNLQPNRNLLSLGGLIVSPEFEESCSKKSTPHSKAKFLITRPFKHTTRALSAWA